MSPAQSWAVLILALGLPFLVTAALHLLADRSAPRLDTWTEDELERLMWQSRAERERAARVDPERRRRILQLLGADSGSER